MMQTPLNVALAASPFFLLTNRMLAGLSLGKPKVLEVPFIFHGYLFMIKYLLSQVWELLGNRQPALLKLAENRLWKAVIDIATTTTPLKITVTNALKDIQNMISSNAAVDGCHPHWFRG